jgi:hypothetical protein
MTMRRQLLGLLAVPLLLGGCAAGEAAAQPETEGHHAGETHQEADPQPQAGDGAPEQATMVCGPQIAGPVTEILQLDEAPHTVSDWADDVYTCTYHLPMGALELSVNVSDTDEQADTYFDARLAETPEAEEFVGLGERAYRTGRGDITVVKDDMTLRVDATALPETFGDNGQLRSAFAFTVASQVMGCWVAHP